MPELFLPVSLDEAFVLLEDEVILEPLLDPFSIAANLSAALKALASPSAGVILRFLSPKSPANAWPKIKAVKHRHKKIPNPNDFDMAAVSGFDDFGHLSELKVNCQAH